MKRKKSNTSKVLSKQKPKRNSKIKKRIFFGCFGMIIVMAITFGSLRLAVLGKNWIVTQLSIYRKSSIISLTKETHESLEIYDRKFLIKSAKKLLIHHPFALNKVAKEIQKNNGFAFVSVRQINLEHLQIHVVKRTPLLLIEVGNKIVNLTRNGIIYTGSSGSQKPSTLLRGVFDQRPLPKQLEDKSFELHDSSRKVILESIELYLLAVKKNIQIKKLVYEEYRGFHIYFNDSKTEVSIGEPPFEDKLQKLHLVLSSLKENGRIAQRIELDYRGKAFIKEFKNSDQGS